MRTTSIARCSALDGETFARTFRGRAPVIVCGAMNDWRACRLWSHAWFAKHYGAMDVQVQIWLGGRLSGQRGTVRSFVDSLGRAPDGVQYCLARIPVFDEAPELEQHFALPSFVGSSRAASYLFMGPADFSTPMHFELSDGLLAQIVGRKRVRSPPRLPSSAK